MKILHFADLHLDASFAASGMTPSVANKRRDELRGCLRRILKYAIENSVDLVTIAGDLYEQDRCTMDTGNFLKEQFERIAPIPVLIAPGNHDPWIPDAWYRQITWPRNVFVFKESKLNPYSIGDVTIWGAAHCSRACWDNLISGIKVPSQGNYLLLLHASDTTSVPKSKSVFCPLNANDVLNSGFKLALLGHYHGARLTPMDHSLLCYPGSPEPLGFDEVGKHYVLQVEIEGQNVTPSLLEIGYRVYVDLPVDVSTAVTRENIRDAVIKLSQEQNLGQAFVRLRLTGMLDPNVQMDSETLLSDLSDFFAFLDIRNETYPAYDLETIKEELTVKGTFVRKMIARVEQAELNQKETVTEALYLGLQAMDRRELKPR